MGNVAAKCQVFGILALRGSVFALEMPVKLYSTQSQGVLETSPLSNLAFLMQVSKEVSKKDVSQSYITT